jgi:iron complex outermembrane receptor protein
VVTGRLISGDRDVIVAPVVLTGEDLARNTQPQIGAMLARLPGVSTSGFAPGASRPVLRGFDGPRVQVLTDGLGSLDASSVSADHGVALDTLNIDRIDVLHGPEVLLYAADPAGGAVNAIDKRIPRRVPDKPVELTAQELRHRGKLGQRRRSDGRCPGAALRRASRRLVQPRR